MAVAVPLFACCACAPRPDGAAGDAAPPEAESQAAPPPAGLPGTDGWQTHEDPDRGLVFRYPPRLDTVYIEAVDWPPQVEVRAGPFSCTEAGSVTARAGRTERREIGGRSWCLTREAEGAAGSVYTLYAYALPTDGKVATLTFSLRTVQCGNYDDPQKTRCEREREAFDIDPVIDAIARTLRIGSR